MIKRKIFYFLIFLITPVALISQIKPDSIITIISQKDVNIYGSTDTLLRIKNLNPYFNIHVDSTLNYPFLINKDLAKYCQGRYSSFYRALFSYFFLFQQILF